MERLTSKVKPLTSAFYYFDLRTGGLIIGFLGIIVSSMNLGACLSMIGYGGRDPVIVILGIVIAVLPVILETLWIHGIYKDMVEMMKPSLIMSAIYCVFFLISSIWGIILCILLLITLHFEGLIYLIIILATAVLVVYCLAVKYFLYLEIKGESPTQTVTVVTSENGQPEVTSVAVTVD